MNVQLSRNVGSDASRGRIYDGAIFAMAESPGIKALREHAITLASAAFAPLDPQTAQFSLDLERFVVIASALKTRFTNDALTKHLIQGVLFDFGCDPERTYFDVPRLRIATSQGYLTAGVGYAYKPHRDTWYSSPPTQINYWFPLFDQCEEHALVFFPDHWTRPLENSSEQFDYAKWQREGRATALAQVAADTRNHPLPQLDPIGEELRFVGGAGTTLAFSSAQMHSSPANTSPTTRYSVDFRTVDLDDLRAGRGAHLIDTRATGTTLADFISAKDFSPLEGVLS